MKNKIMVHAGGVLRFYAEHYMNSDYAFRWNFYDVSGTYVGRTTTSESPFDWTVPDGVSAILVSYPSVGEVSLTNVTPLDVRIAALEAKQ